MIKIKLGIMLLLLSTGSLLFAGEQSATDILRGHERVKASPRYLVVYGKVVAKRTSAGYTRFNYRDGIVISEITQTGVIGTYMYDHLGRLLEIQYTDGKRIKVAYDESGKVKQLSGVGKRIARFSDDTPLAPKGKENLGRFLSVQEGMEAMDGDGFCDTGDLDSDCVIIIHGQRGGGEGPGTGDTGFIPRFPESGGGGGGWGGGGGKIYPSTGTVYETAAECKDMVCEGGKRDHELACKIMAGTNPDSLRRCYDKAFEFYSNCLRSCGNADWAWLDTFNWVY